MQTRKSRKWTVPLLCLFFGIAYLVAFWMAGNPGAGLAPLGIMIAYGLLLLLGGRSEIVRVLRNQPPDERYRMFDLRATAFSGGVTLAVLIGGFFYELARGQDGNPYGLLCGIAGIAYIVALLWMRWRS